MSQDNNIEAKPFKFPDAWPTDGCSKLVQVLGRGWAIYHRQRDPMIFENGRWQPLLIERGVA